MNSSNLKNLSFILLIPYIFSVAPPDSSFTEFALGLGTGQYAAHDCSGPHPKTFTDVGFKMTHKFEGPFRVGLIVNPIFSGSRGGVIPYPDLALDWKYFSLGTTGVRVGRLDDIYGELAIGDQVPAFSGRGFVRYGVGWTVADWDTRFWLGQNELPYSQGWAGQVDFPVGPGKYVFVNGRLGNYAGIQEYGISIGLRIRDYEVGAAK